MNKYLVVLFLLLCVSCAKPEKGDSGSRGPAGEQGISGAAGIDGADAPAGPFQVQDIIDPCGDNPGKYDEVLLRTADDKFFAVYADGTHTFLSELTAGNYVTTDEQHCYFSLDGAGNIFNEHI